MCARARPARRRNLADFKTAQAIKRPGGLNHKGVFTRDRRPKAAAHLLRARWGGAAASAEAAEAAEAAARGRR